ncbi:TetR/AcrR family transcriptional regulator [[Mycobacterium] vasticus]|uniref:TetR/AcrR family transcriptional regulator n=1 Tax=[Mycobacterium] vasticus TaxID=2875777 RepID=A0ABU5Z3Z9_9MYCO|nr:TetR/AcrR family transcriptional regulator [Mycolicibacter sp. MYC017]MEB3070693.1 TetR/AcrR family transcriptional regulator [Mycolicibacter sp. MYC017]
MTDFETVRRQGYAPDNASVGRRGQHTRERILACAANLFFTDGYHGTSIDAIAKAAGGSRATVYQYFESKDAILAELAAPCREAVLDHGHSLGRLGPDEAGLRELHRWLIEWESLHDQYMLVFLNFPGIGAIGNHTTANTDTTPQLYTEIIANKLHAAGIRGIEPIDAAATLLRIAHMVNLPQFRTMFDLPDYPRVTASLAIAMQRLIFPETPHAVLATIGCPTPAQTGLPGSRVPTDPVTKADEPDATTVSPIRDDILSAASAMFSGRGYYAVAMDDIATAAEVSRATLYRHFSTKVALLSELSSWAVLESARLSLELRDLTADPSRNSLRGWLAHYVRHHRAYAGVIRAWYDGAIFNQLPGDAVARGMGELYRAVYDYLGQQHLCAAMDRSVVTGVFLAALGRLSEYAAVQHPDEKDYDTGGFILTVLQRAILSDRAQ